MRIEISKKLFTVDDYYRMAEAGIFTEARTIGSSLSMEKSFR